MRLNYRFEALLNKIDSFTIHVVLFIHGKNSSSYADRVHFFPQLTRAGYVDYRLAFELLFHVAQNTRELIEATRQVIDV